MNSPVLTKCGSKSTMRAKLEGFWSTFGVVSNPQCLFLLLTLYNLYTSKIIPTTKKDNILIFGACAALAMQTCEIFHQHFLEDLYKDYFSKQELTTKIEEVSKLLDYNVIGLIPFVYFKTINIRVIRMLIAFEMSPYENIHPYSVAKFVAETCGVEYIEMPFEPKDSSAVITKILIEPCRYKDTDDTMDQIVNAVWNRRHHTSLVSLYGSRSV
jgi:hypothetical protein